MFRVNQIKEEEEEKMGPEEEGQQQATTVTARSSSSLTKIKIKLINEERSNKQQVASFKLFKSILILVLVYVLIQINSNLNLNSKNLLVSCTKLNEELESTTRKENQSFLLKSAQLNSWLDRNVTANADIRTQPDDLVAIGAASLLTRLSSDSAKEHAHPVERDRGRITERIAALATDTNGQSVDDPGHAHKLDYIIRFMKSNKLTKFCDLLTDPKGQFVARQLNQMKQFTLFVPTNEALLLMPSEQLERLRSRSDELAKFILSHVTSDLVVPKLNITQLASSQADNRAPPVARSETINRLITNDDDNSKNDISLKKREINSMISIGTSSLVYTLTGSPLRISTLPVNTWPQSASRSSDIITSNGLELIVNGANVLPGQSYALQEPNNLNTTHAVVHLIDRSLYPPPTSNLLELVRQLAPTMSSLLSLVPEIGLKLSESTHNLTTLFVPNEDAFRATPPQMLDKLHTNRTFLVQFIRSHWLAGLHFTGQLGANSDLNIKNNGQQLDTISKAFVSLAGEQLNFQSKSVQNRRLILVNSVPIVGSDLMATNGVLHLVSRPLFPSNLVDDCNCPSGTQTLGQTERESTSTISSTIMPRGRIDRSQRSLGDLPIGPNKDKNYYRPSLTPANLQLSSSDGSLSLATQAGSIQAPLDQLARLKLGSSSGDIVRRRQDSGSLDAGRDQNAWFHSIKPQSNGLSLQQQQQQQQATASNSIEQQTQQIQAQPQYQVTLNATSRLKLRAEQKQQQQTTSNQFIYDQPLLTSTSRPIEPLSLNSSNGSNDSATNAFKRLYTSAALLAAEPNAPMKVDSLLRDESAKREQQLLKFQPEDGRTSMANARLKQPQSNSEQVWPNSASSNMQPAYDLHPSQASSLERSKKMSGPNQSTSVACAFYDLDCRRLMGRLVRLPARKSPQSDIGQVISNRTSSNYDSTFGEAHNLSEAIISGSSTRASITEPTAIMVSRNPILSGRYLDDNQQLNSKWRAQEMTDLARLSALNQQYPAHGFTVGISKIQNNTNSSGLDMVGNHQSGRLTSDQGPMRQAQILFVPVKLVKEGAGFVPRLNLSDTETIRPAASILLVPSSSGSTQAAQITPQSLSEAQLMNANHYMNPSVFSSTGILSNRVPQETGRLRLKNSTTHDDALEGFEWPAHGSGQTPNRPDLMAAAKRNNLRVPVSVSQFPMTPALIHRKQMQQMQLQPNHQQQQQQQQPHYQYLTPKQIGGSFSNHLKSPMQQALRNPNVKWPEQANVQQQAADISITSARLTQNNNNASGYGLATQASDQQPFVGHRPTVPVSGGDYFQDRTIAEIMDDSGLRIDGQLVTFKRLKRCLSEANLLNLASQTGNSLTIFMPTDQAFQRLVQHAITISNQQQRQRDPLQSHRNGNLHASNSNHIPLLVRAQNELSSSIQPGTTTTTTTTTGSAFLDGQSQLDRLTLDCQTPQARQLLLDHISARFIAPRQLVNDMSISSLSGKQLILSSVPSKQIVVVDGQPVLAATQAKNGMVYVINKFLNLTNQMSNVFDLMDKQPELSTFTSYLRSTMNDRLKRELGPLTVLAPTNEAFEQLTPSARQLIDTDPSALMDIMRSHIVEGAQYGKLISMRAKLKTMNANQDIDAKVIKPNVYMLDNQLTSMRLVGTTGNGVVNAVDRLIVPSWLRNSMSGSNQARQTFNSQIEPTSASLERQFPRSNLPMINEKPLRFEHSDLNHGNADTIFRNNFARNTNLLRSPSDERLLQLGSLRNNSIQLSSPSRLNIDSVNSVSSEGDSSTNDLFSVNEIQPNLNANFTKNMQLIQKLANLMQARKFLKLIFRSKVYESLKPDMNYVILVPTDKAIERLPAQITTLLERDPDKLVDLVNYHILDTTFDFINTIPDGQTLQTLNEKDILFNWHRNNTVLTVSGAVVLGGIQEENIALLIVDRVLYPTPGDLLSIVSKSPILSNFTSIIRNAELESLLTRAGPYTLFAPSDLAFSQLERADLEFLQKNKEIARRFLHRHLTSPMVFTSSIALSNNNGTSSRMINGGLMTVPSMTITNSLGEDLTLRQQNDYFSVNDINFSYADVAATNGVVHVIDGLL